MRLEGACCLVTGCSSGIGYATALALQEAGGAVWATGRRLDSLETLGSRGLRVADLDVTDGDQVRRCIAKVGRIDVLVNNAGYGLEGAIEEVADDELLAQYDVNVFGVWRMSRAVLPGMRAQGRGAIVNVSSFGGVAPYPGIGAYRTSKFAVEGLSWTLHLEVAHFGIRVIDVQPGLTASEFGPKMLRARRTIDAYDGMRESAARAYPRMSPKALPAEVVADAIVAELRRDAGPLRVRVGEDADRMRAAICEGDEAYERYLVDLGLDWHSVRA
jgi:NAD(P)-dependent dehydrogenase (short-subunit alcohol dehydrogenase family)